MPVPENAPDTKKSIVLKKYRPCGNGPQARRGGHTASKFNSNSNRVCLRCTNLAKTLHGDSFKKKSYPLNTLFS